MRRYFLLILIIQSSLTSRPQAVNDTVFSTGHLYTTKQLRQDLAILKDSLYRVHPAVFRFTSKKSLDAAFASAYKSISRPMNVSAFYVTAVAVISKVGDIHTTAELPDDYHAAVASQSKLLPFDVRIIDGSVFIASNNSKDSSIEVGSALLQINGHPVKLVLQKMLACFSGEGLGKSLQVKKAEQRFAFQYHFIYGYSKKFVVQYKSPGQPVATKTVDALSFAEIAAGRTNNKIKYPLLKPVYQQAPYLSLLLNKEKNAAILTVKWFQNDVLAENGEYFKPFIDSAFTAIKKSGLTNLIIDIRNNGGGESENAAYLYSYITLKNFTFIQYLETNKSTYTDDKKWGIKYTYNKENGKYRTADSSMAIKFPRLFGLAVQAPHKNNFTGNVYLLVDGLTTSAAPQFASLVKIHKRGVLIGEEVPGSLYGGSGRGYAYFALPNTGLLIMISRYRVYIYSGHGKKQDTLIFPDHIIQPGITDLLNGRDLPLEKSLQLAAEKE